MKTWKTVFIVCGIFLVLSVISVTAYLSPIEVGDKCKPQKNAPNVQSDGVGWVERNETQQSNLSLTSIGDPKLELDKEEFAQKTRKLQMPFIANNGQVDEQVEFYAKTFGGTVFVTKEGEIVYALPKTEKSECRLGEAERTQQAANPQAKPPFNSPNLKSQIPNPKSEISGIALREKFVDAKVNAIQGEDPSVTKVNYFKGSDPSKWKTNVSTYDAVSLGDVYDGIELRLKAYGNNVEKLFCVKPGADPEQIKISLSGIQPAENPPPTPASGGQPPVPLGEGDKGGGDGTHNSSCKWGAAEKSPLENGITTESPLKKGARGLWVNEEGQLVAETELGPVKFTKPIAYQEIDGKRVEVEVEYKVESLQLKDENTKCETLNTKLKTLNAKLASTKPNPQSEIRNPKSEYGFTVASYDRAKDLIIDPLLASTYLGGSGDDYRGYSLALDTSGNVYVTGPTLSTDFPTTTGAYNTSFNGVYYDVFVSKLDGGLTTLLASTYLGDSSQDIGYSLTLDTSGNVYVTGSTQSTDFPTTSGAYNASYNGGLGDVFVSKLNGGLTSLLASTFLGGSGYDRGVSLALDTSGNVYVTGSTELSDFPTTSGAYDTSFNGGFGDVFVSKLNGGLTTMLASTYLGGSGQESGYSLTLDTSGNVYVTGETTSSDFPTTSVAYDAAYNGGDYDVFVSKLNSGLTSLLASTYLGGSGYDQGNSLALDTSGNVYVTGDTWSTDFPTTSGAYNASYNGGTYDVFVSKLNSGLTSLLASTYLGGAGQESGYSLTLDTSGNVYVTGWTYSTDFPTTSGAYDTSYNGNDDVFVSKLNSGLTTMLASTYLGGSGSGDGGFSLALDTSGDVYVTGWTNSTNFPTTSGAYDTSFNGGGDVFVSKLDGDLSASTTTPTPTPTSSPVVTPTPTLSPSPTVTPTPSGCDGVTTNVETDTGDFVLLKRESKVVTVTVTDTGGCPVADKKVSAKVNHAGKSRIKISSSRETTDENGKASFTITAKKKTGNAKVIFKAGGIIKKITVKVVSE